MTKDRFYFLRAFRSNLKTGFSVDLTTNCPNNCVYCYTQQRRGTGIYEREIVDELYYGGEILHLTQEEVDRLNRSGGLRLFSGGDCPRVENYNEIPEWALQELTHIKGDADEKRLSLKAFTKNIIFANWAVRHNIRCQLSIDSFGTGFPLEQALSLRLQYPHLVRIRTLVENPTRIAYWGERIDVDILTLYHGRNLEKYNLQTMPWYRSKAFAQAAHDYPTKVCCQTGKCETCPVKCGYTT